MQQNPTQSEVIKRFLTHYSRSDLADLYHEGMEVQVNVAQDDGEREEYKTPGGRTVHAFSNGVETWKSFRIPYKAFSDPEYDPKPMTFDLVVHAEGVGMTGWNWRDRQSIFVGFDFDSLMGHSAGLTVDELEEVQRQLESLSYVQIRTSTSGNGLHVYVYLNDNQEIANHHEHAAVARAVLGKMSADVGYNFESSVDVCGHVLWQWHRKLAENGLLIVKDFEEKIKIPVNWRDHLDVVSKRSSKTSPGFVNKGDQSFEQLSGQTLHVQLDDSHKELLRFLEDQPFTSWWDADHWMLVTHTKALKAAHDKLNLRGIFDTISDGNDPGTQNCFCFPLRGGGWTVRRFSKGVQESPSWNQDRAGWTSCTFNMIPTLEIASRATGGIENQKNEFVFTTADEASKALQTLGVDVSIPTRYSARKASLKPQKDGRVFFSIEATPGEDTKEGMDQWLLDKSKWGRLIKIQNTSQDNSDPLLLDDYIRHVVDRGNNSFGWFCKLEHGWVKNPITNVDAFLQAMGHARKDLPVLRGASVSKSWKIVNKPFQSEYPGDRQWNMGAAKFALVPNTSLDSLHFPTWNMVLNHIGEALTPAVKGDEWCQRNGITTGREYLIAWICNLFQKPDQPLPYLFLFGEQNCGKSILHEALSLLINPGVQRADVSLTSTANFNGELEGKVLCIIEETELTKRSIANRIKDWVTSRDITIHVKGMTPYMTPNTTHWIQCANEQTACPIFPGDTRITVIHVKTLPNPVPKAELLARLKKEGSDFLAYALHCELPEAPERLSIPALATSEKNMIMQGNMSALQDYLQQEVHNIPGSVIPYTEFCDKFRSWLASNGFAHEVTEWTNTAIAKRLPPEFPTGRWKSNENHVGNASYDPNAEVRPILMRTDKRRLVPYGD